MFGASVALLNRRAEPRGSAECWGVQCGVAGGETAHADHEVAEIGCFRAEGGRRVGGYAGQGAGEVLPGVAGRDERVRRGYAAQIGPVVGEGVEQDSGNVRGDRGGRGGVLPGPGADARRPGRTVGGVKRDEPETLSSSSDADVEFGR